MGRSQGADTTLGVLMGSMIVGIGDIVAGGFDAAAARRDPVTSSLTPGSTFYRPDHDLDLVSVALTRLD